MTTQYITFAGTTLAIDFSSPSAKAVLDLLFGNLPPSPHRHPTLNYSLHESPSATLTVYREEILLSTTDSLATTAEILLGDVCHQLAAHSQDGLLFHAAALAWGEKGVILPGTMGAGKTTLSAWLLSQSFDYLSDELVFIAQASKQIQAFTRPLNLKATARPALQPFFDFETQQGKFFRSSQADLISPTLIKPTNALSTPALNLIIFPNYQSQHDLEIKALSKAQAGLALMQTLVNARNLPEHGFPQITQLVQQAPAYKITYSHFDQLLMKIEALF